MHQIHWQFQKYHGLLSPQKGDRLFCFSGEHLFSGANILLDENNQIPQATQNLNTPYYCFAKDSNNKHCFIYPGKISNTQQNSIKSSYGLLDQETIELVSLGRHLAYWRESNRFCGRCGYHMKDHHSERALYCMACNYFEYPKISPCIIVLIYKQDQFLLARSPFFRPGLYSTVAGHVEPGEMIEQTVHREIMEEVGVKVKNLEYITSQPWPYPNSLMLGFLAEYDSGEINVDGVEIEDAKWFSRDNMPEAGPSEVSIAGLLLRTYLER